MSSISHHFQNFRWDSLRQDPVPFLITWVLSGCVVIFVPVIHRANKMNDYFLSVGQYEEQRSGDNNGYFDINNCKWWQWNCESVYYDYDGNRVYPDQYGNYNNNNNDRNDNGYSKICKWYQMFGCENEYYNDNGEREYRDGGGYPSWFNGWAYDERDRNSRDEMNNNGVPIATSGMKFVYSWSIIMFVGLVVYGFYTMYKRHNFVPLIVILGLFANFSFLAMFLLAQTIQVEGRGLETYGFFAQMPVLMFMTAFWQTLFAIGFTIYLCIRKHLEIRKERQQLLGESHNLSSKKNGGCGAGCDDNVTYLCNGYIEMETNTTTTDNDNNSINNNSLRNA